MSPIKRLIEELNKLNVHSIYREDKEIDKDRWRTSLIVLLNDKKDDEAVYRLEGNFLREYRNAPVEVFVYAVSEITDIEALAEGKEKVA